MDPEALVREQYTRMALVYDERVAPRFRPIAERTVALAALRPGERALDVGCGTGLATLLAAEQVGPRGEVVGVDFSEGQLGIAAGKAQLRGVSWARFERADATRLPYEAAFEAALSNLGMPDDLPAALAGMRRALRPGGRLSVTEWARGPGLNQSFDTFRALVERHRLAEPPPEVLAARRAMAARRSRQLQWGSAAQLQAAVEEVGFRDARVEVGTHRVPFGGWREFYDFLLSWGWTEQEVRALPGPDREALQRDCAAAFGQAPFTDTWQLLHASARRP